MCASIVSTMKSSTSRSGAPVAISSSARCWPRANSGPYAAPSDHDDRAIRSAPVDPTRFSVLMWRRRRRAIPEPRIRNLTQTEPYQG
jgi:hypothetical protein